MAPTWFEVEQANEEKRCELVLSGANISQRIEEDGLDISIFKIKHLNFLEISRTSLQNLPPELGDLIALTRVTLHNNKLQKIPPSIENLKKLKFLDVSFNSLAELPSGISKLTDLQSLNFSHNKLTDLPSFSKLVNLVSLNIAHNDFTEFPAVSDTNLIHFSELIANNNGITSIPADINQLTALKVFNISENALISLPGELADCTKMKELNLKDNKLKDKRLVKLIDQCHVKQVMEYIRSHCAKSTASDEVKQAKSKKKAKQNKKASANDEIIQLLDQISVLHVQDDTVKIISRPNVQEVRPCVVSCILKDVNLSKEHSLKKFITMQTRLHESVCEKRTAATIATHDLSKINGDVFYDAKDPKTFKILPLNRKKDLTASELYTVLNTEADNLRKEKKKNTYSGIHKYLYLLKEKPLYPYLSDASGQVISFPPITNSETTKVSEDTKQILVEVTGNSLSSCKKVLDTLLEEVLKLGIGNPQIEDNEEEDASICQLVVQQVKIVDEEGKLKVVYPSRTDIQNEKINVIRA